MLNVFDKYGEEIRRFLEYLEMKTVGNDTVHSIYII